MITIPELAAEALGSFLAADMKDRFGSSNSRLTELIPSAARLAIECIGNSDAFYHNIEHTMLVTLAGHDILRGRALVAATSASDYAHLIVACLTHDIGYVRGILKGDGEDGFVIDKTGRKVSLPLQHEKLGSVHVRRLEANQVFPLQLQIDLGLTAACPSREWGPLMLEMKIK